MADYQMNRGVGKPAEFKGLSGQYLFLLAGGLLAVIILFMILFMIGIAQWICITFGIITAFIILYSTFSLSKKYGNHGLMKLYAKKSHLRYIINRKAIFRIIKSR